MTEVGVETLKEHLADYLKRAREGERIVITENGRSVALLIPLEGNETVRRQRPRNRGKLASDMVLEDRR